jgi:hypothetical protein
MAATIPSDILYRLLLLEEKLGSYERLHAEELEQIRQALHELKIRVLALAEQKQEPASQEVNPTTSRKPITGAPA